MTIDMEKRYQERLARYVTAMRNEKPDTFFPNLSS